MNDHSHTLERQDSTAARSYTSNAFSDRFELDEYSPVDGMAGRPDAGMPGRHDSPASDEEEPVDSINAHYADDHLDRPHSLREARNSMRKSRGFIENPFRSEEDDVGRGSSHQLIDPSLSRQTTDDTYRDDTSLSGNTMVSSTRGAGYRNEYAQNIALTRTPSAAPSTIIAQTTGRQSLHGPSHQYNMYPQNVDEDLDDASSQAGTNHDIPVGFPPSMLNTSRYRHDLDNLSEQLPPYSEYPEDGAPKLVGVPPRIDEVSPTVERNAQSMSDGNASNRTEEIIPMSEKNRSEKTWKEKKKTRFCGIKFGWIVLIIGVFLFIVIVLSATIGGFFGAQANKTRKANENTMIDASPIQSTLRPLPTGSFQLQLGPPQEFQAECLTDPSQASSWNCGVSTPNSLAINISPLPNNQGQGAIIYPAAGESTIGYGTEIPRTIRAALRPVKDMDAPEKGEAYQFQAVYTKIVVAPPEAFEPYFVTQTGASSSPQKRSEFYRNDKRSWAPLAEAGDQPWFCFWNNTLIEGFIYIHQNSTSWYGDSATNQKRGWDDREENMPWSGFAGPSMSSPTPAASAMTSAGLMGAGPQTTSSTTGSYAASACTYISGTAYPASPTDKPDVCPPALGDDEWSQLDFFPYVVKIEERRIPGNTGQAYCQKMQILDNGQLGYLQDPTGKPYRVDMSESSPDLAAYDHVYGATSRKVRRSAGAMFSRARNADLSKRAVVPGACHCQWVSGED